MAVTNIRQLRLLSDSLEDCWVVIRDREEQLSRCHNGLKVVLYTILLPGIMLEKCVSIISQISEQGKKWVRRDKRGRVIKWQQTLESKKKWISEEKVFEGRRTPYINQCFDCHWEDFGLHAQTVQENFEEHIDEVNGPWNGLLNFDFWPAHSSNSDKTRYTCRLYVQPIQRSSHNSIDVRYEFLWIFGRWLARFGSKEWQWRGTFQLFRLFSMRVTDMIIRGEGSGCSIDPSDIRRTKRLRCCPTTGTPRSASMPWVFFFVDNAHISKSEL